MYLLRVCLFCENKVYAVLLENIACRNLRVKKKVILTFYPSKFCDKLHVWCRVVHRLLFLSAAAAIFFHFFPVGMVCQNVPREEIWIGMHCK